MFVSEASYQKDVESYNNLEHFIRDREEHLGIGECGGGGSCFSAVLA